MSGQLVGRRGIQAVLAPAEAAAPRASHPAPAQRPLARNRPQPGVRTPREGSPAGRRVARQDARRASRSVGGLRAWVTWLYDRYELSVEDRLPRCWPRHPGLVEELDALKAWRRRSTAAASHRAGRPVLARRASAGAARGHHPVRAGCRTGHRGTVRLAAEDPTLLQEWAAAHPLARVPGSTWQRAPPAVPAPSPLPPQSPRRLTTARRPRSRIRDTLFSGGRWLAPAASGWIEIPELERCGLPAPPLQFGQASADSEGDQPDPWTMT